MTNTPLSRVYAITGCRTKLQLSSVLGARCARISDARRRGSVPREWLTRLERLYGVTPEWVRSGTEPRYLKPEHACEAEQPGATACSLFSTPAFTAALLGVLEALVLCLQSASAHGQSTVQAVENTPRAADHAPGADPDAGSGELRCYQISAAALHDEREYLRRNNAPTSLDLLQSIHDRLVVTVTLMNYPQTGTAMPEHMSAMVAGQLRELLDSLGTVQRFLGEMKLVHVRTMPDGIQEGQ